MLLKDKWKKSLFDNTLLVLAITVALLLHGTSFLYSFPKTYDAYVHIFLANHYANSWFEPWEFRWYTGFTVTSYPPLLHQLTAFLSFFVGLKAGFFLVTITTIIVLVIGVYRFSKIWVSERSAQYAAILSVITPSIVETIHVFGQIPTLIGIGCLLNALPDIYNWFRGGNKYYFSAALSLLYIGACSHHITIIFGIVFFLYPIIGVSIFDKCNFLALEFTKATLIKYFEEIKKALPKLLLFHFALFSGLILLIFPYWYNVKYDPIAQIPIPHGSRDNFFLVQSSGTIFFVAFWGILLPFFFYALKRSCCHRNIFLFIPYVVLFILGTGGTTPIPKLLLGANAFNILTLERFSFWATILTLPFAGELCFLLLEGNWGDKLTEKYGKTIKKVFISFIIFFFVLETFIIINLGAWNYTQPATINIEPIVNFLSRDEHFRWRYLTLGFGDQMAWLSANTNAQCIDGNYHSARRLPELTTRAIERLENAKYKGVDGIGALEQFLTVPEKYHLKFVFSNDKFYDPLLYYAGWHRVQRLENGIMVWEKQDVPKIPPQVIPTTIPFYQKIMWGSFPLIALLIAIYFFAIRKFIFYNRFDKKSDVSLETIKTIPYQFSDSFWKIQNSLIIVIPILFSIYILSDKISDWWADDTPQRTIEKYYDMIDKQLFKDVHTLIYPQKNMPLEQFILEISVEDGILSSFASLDSVGTKIISQTDSTVAIATTTKWVTPIEVLYNNVNHFLQKKDGKWLLKVKNFDLTIPADESIRRSSVLFFNQGKRRVSTASTVLDDVLDRPELNILDAQLVKHNNHYSVVGQIYNNDNYPAHLTITAVLHDSVGNIITEYNAQHYTHHKILPKESTPFRIDFEDTEWIENPDKQVAKLKPGAFLPYTFRKTPVSCNLFVHAVSEDKDLFKIGDIHNLSLQMPNDTTTKTYLKGSIINNGVDEITIPQIIISYKNNKNEVEWVERKFLPYGVRPQRKQGFLYEINNNLDNLIPIYKLKETDKNVNGLLNSQLQSAESKKSSPLIEKSNILLTKKGKDYYISVSANSFLSTPTIY